MDKTDEHPYANDLLSVRLESGPGGVRVSTSQRIPCNRTIRQTLAAALIAIYGLDANYSTEGGVDGILEHDDLDEVGPVEMRWTGSPHEIYLMSDSPMNPFAAEGYLAERLAEVLEIALFNRRDDQGYPLLLSTDNAELAVDLLLNAFLERFGARDQAKILESLASPAGSNIQLAGLV